MIQYKNGKFAAAIKSPEIDYASHGGNEYAALTAAGFEQLSHFGSEHVFSVTKYVKPGTEADNWQWLMLISHGEGWKPHIWCDNEADFLDLLFRAGPLCMIHSVDFLADFAQELTDGVYKAVSVWNSDRHETEGRADASVSGFLEELAIRMR